MNFWGPALLEAFGQCDLAMDLTIQHLALQASKYVALVGFFWRTGLSK